MSLAAGARLGPYEVVGLLGAGGMGEVYRARDTKLGRDIALKVLPDTVALDPDRRARFDREAQVLAALNHPHIAQIYGLEDRALVMELVEGETLDSRIARGPIPWNEALPLLQQIAAGLEAAHDRGIIHRDLKPANIKITPSGAVKILDFGLAKLNDAGGHASGMSSSATLSPTITSPAMTGVGVLLGTAAYMAPEQARGMAVDRRADVWAFGVIAYEMVTGTRPFTGETITDVLAGIVKDDVRLQSLPGHVRPLVAACLQKDPAKRLRDIGDLPLVLRDDRVEQITPLRRATVFAVVLSALVTLTAIAIAWRSWRQPAQPLPLPMRFELALPDGVTADVAAIDLPLIELSPNGRYIAFRAVRGGERPRIWIRTLADGAVRPLPGTDAPQIVLWSPDSNSIAWVSGGMLKRAELTGGSRTIASVPGGGVPLGGAWTNDDVIVLGAARSTLQSLMRVPAAGGTLGPALGSINGPPSAQTYPISIDADRMLYVKSGPAVSKPGVYAASLAAGTERFVLADVGQPRLAGDALLYVRDGVLFAQRLDLQQLTPVGDPTVIADGVGWIQDSGRAAFSVSKTGMIVYAGGSGYGLSQLTWVSRGGQVQGTVGEAGTLQTMALSPDGTRVVYGRRDQQALPHLWTTDIRRGVSTPLTLGGARDSDGTWSPDMSRIAYNSLRAASIKSLFVMPAAGGVEQPLHSQAGVPISADDWSADGKFVLYHQDDIGQLWALPLQAPRTPLLVYKAPAGRVDEATFSPDGKWVAFNSEETGTAQVFIVPFPATGAHWQVSPAGGVQPQWRRDGRELYFLDPDANMMAVDIALDTAPTLGRPHVLFKSDVVASFNVDTYAAAPDGQRFLLMRPLRGVSEPLARAIVNWTGLRAEAVK